MTHRTAPLTVEGRRRLIERCHDRPIAHVAAEMGISRQCASTWVNRYRKYGDLGLQDRSSTPHHQPTATAAGLVAEIEAMRRTRKWSASRITFELGTDGITIARRTVTRILRNLGLPPVHRPERRNQPKTAGHRCETTWSDGARRRQESREDPGRRRVACPRPRVRQGPTIPAPETEEQAGPHRLHIPAFRDRRQHPPGVHRGTRQRNRSNSHRFHEQRTPLLPRPTASPESSA